MHFKTAHQVYKDVPTSDSKSRRNPLCDHLNTHLLIYYYFKVNILLLLCKQKFEAGSHFVCPKFTQYEIVYTNWMTFAYITISSHVGS